MAYWNEVLYSKVTKQIAEDLKAKGQYLVQNKGMLEAWVINEWESHQFVEALGEVTDLFVRCCCYRDIKFAIDDLTSPLLTRRLAATLHLQEFEHGHDPFEEG